MPAYLAVLPPQPTRLSYLPSLPGSLTSLAYLAVLPLHPAWLSYLPSLPGCLTAPRAKAIALWEVSQAKRENSRPSLAGVLFQMKHDAQVCDTSSPPQGVLFCSCYLAILSSLLPLYSSSFPPCLYLSPLSPPQPCLTKSQLKPALQFAHAIRDHLHNIAGD